MKPTLWRMLEKIRTIQSTIEDHMLHTVHHTQGTVQVEQAASNKLILHEQGTIHIATNKTLPFRNTYKFVLNTHNSISLSHLRRGAAHPVYLLRFFAKTPNNWHAPNPHICSKDVYQASIHIHPNQTANAHIVLTWTITGTNKNTSIRTVYF